MSIETAIAEALRVVIREELERILGGPTPQPANEPRLLDVEEAAQRLGLSSSTVYKKANTGDIPSVKQGSRLLFEPAALDAYVASHRRSKAVVVNLAAVARSR